jgi:phosphoglycolate phosphatase
VEDKSRDLVMFDYDGVIVDSFEVFATAFVDACRMAGIDAVTTPEQMLALFEDNFYVSLRAAGASDVQIEKVLSRTAQALIRASHWLRPFPLMPQVLAELGDSRTVMIVTSSPEAVVEGWLRRHGVQGVAEVAGAESGRSKVEKIRDLTARFAGQEAFWFVGDTAGDMREAREAGVTPLGVAWGWHDPELLEQAGAELVAAAPAELLAIVAPDLRADFLGLG